MIGRITRSVSMAVVALLVGAMLVPGEVQAQDGRFRVFVPNFFPAEGTDDDFGKDVAEELRELMEALIRHVPVEKDEIEDGLDEIDMDLGDLAESKSPPACVLSRQFAPRINAQVVVCADYAENAGGGFDFTNVQFISVEAAQSFDVDDFSVPEDDEEVAAQRIFEAFDRFQQFEQDRGNCFYYAGLDQFEDAVRNCEDALSMNPDDAPVQFQMAQIFRQQDDNEAALERVQRVIEIEPQNEDALYLGGFLASELGREEAALDYFSTYLQLKPDASNVRLRIAYDLAQEGGDYGSAMALIEEGMTEDADIALHEARGGYAFRLAGQLMMGVPRGPEGEQNIPEEVRELYRTAIQDLTRVFEARGDSTNTGNLRNVINAHLQLGNPEDAVEFGSRVVEVFPEEEGILAAYATAVGRTGDIDRALDAWQRVGELNPEYPQLYERQANMLLRADRRDDAVPLLKQAVGNGFDPNAAARMIFSDAYNKGVRNQPRQLGYALAGIQSAKEFETNSMTTSMLNFFHGYVRFLQAQSTQDGETVAAARASLPIFQEARTLLEQGREYAASEDQDLATLLSNVADFIEIQELIIERG